MRVVIGRELTKLHEQIEVGSLDELALETARGEYTILIEFGHQTKNRVVLKLPSTQLVVAEFGEITKNRAMTRRQAISQLSRKYGIQARELYALLEASKSSPV